MCIVPFHGTNEELELLNWLSSSFSLACHSSYGLDHVFLEDFLACGAHSELLLLNVLSLTEYI